MKAIKRSRKSQQKGGIKPDHKTNEDFNQQEPRLDKTTSMVDKQQHPVYDKNENTDFNDHPSNGNAQVIIKGEREQEKALETKNGDSDAELSKDETHTKVSRKRITNANKNLTHN